MDHMQSRISTDVTIVPFAYEVVNKIFVNHLLLGMNNS